MRAPACPRRLAAITDAYHFEAGQQQEHEEDPGLGMAIGRTANPGIVNATDRGGQQRQ